MELTWQEVKAAFRQMIAEELGYGRCEIAQKWVDGTLILKPADTSKQSKEIPIETFFKKITAVRERLRVLEQKVNNNDHLTTEERVEFQQLITRAYGSLTSFNVLFRDDEDKFVGMKGA